MPGHWPGGVPSHIRPHHTADLSFDEIKEEVKGWLLFVKESWISRAQAGVHEDEDDDYELRQRRALIHKWAAATQEFRDHAKAANQLFGDMNLCTLEDWKEDVEVYAPGYLALEAAGRGQDYDLRNLVAPEEVMMRTKPALWRLLSAHGLPTD